MRKQTILVTNSLYDSGVHAVRSLASAGYKVVGVDFGRLPFGIRSRFTHAQHTVSRTSEEQLQKDLLDLVKRYRPAALLPLGTRFVHTAILLRDRIEATTAVNVPELDSYFAAYDKRECMAECCRLGIPHPRVYSFDEASSLLARKSASLTLVVKPDFDVGGAQGLRYVRTCSELKEAVAHCEHLYRDVLIEEYIPGGADCMKTVVTLFASDSRLIAAFTMQKVRQWPPSGGLTALARSTADAAVLGQVLPLLEHWRWRGGAEVELKYDRRDGLHKVIEVNPRFPAYLRFGGVCGLNLPVLAVELALNGENVQPVSFPGYAVGRVFCSPDAYLRAAVAGLREKGSTPARLRTMLGEAWEAVPSLAGVLLDPLPTLGRVFSHFEDSNSLRTSFYVRHPEGRTNCRCD